VAQTIQCFLIDDDMDDQEIFAMALGEIDQSIRCMTANDGVEALETLSDKTLVPDFIFLDINMPRMNGLECLRALKDLKHLKDTEVIMYSTTSDQRLIDKSMQFGASDFLVKPSALSTLTQKLADVLGYNQTTND
jgi:CheY-like chemotaxis protein